MAKGSFKLGASSKSIDPTLDALFTGSSGPVKPHPKSKYSEAPPLRPDQDEGSESGAEEEPEEASDEELEQGNDEDDEDDGDEVVSQDEESSENETNGIEERVLGSGPSQKTKERKRKREAEDDLEGKYLNKLVQEEQAQERKEKRQKQQEEAAKKAEESTSSDGTSSSEEDEEGAEEVEEEEASSDEDEDEDKDGDIPMHESLVAAKSKDKKTPESSQDADLDKANRTVFLANVAAEASTSKPARRILLNHLSRVLPSDGSKKIESIRFRSLAFSTNSMPKRAAYITSSLMDATTKSANAYVVYPDAVSARRAFAELNGTVVLDRHLRVDSVAHPSPTDHRRCVFVGNLGFVDDETVLNMGADGETKQRKRTKVPADVEEGLWRTFGQHAGKVENVRVVRDPKTRVGKGFAYIQFVEGTSVESALLLDAKKFPPMLPRALRVTRAKAPQKTALAMERSKAKSAKDSKSASGGDDNPDKAKKPKSTKYQHKATPEEQSMAGRAGKLLGRSAALRAEKDAKSGDRTKKSRTHGQAHGNGSGILPKRSPEEIIFEGRRASANDGRPNDVKVGGGKKKRKGAGRVEKAKGRGAKRAQAWRQKGKSSS